MFTSIEYLNGRLCRVYYFENSIDAFRFAEMFEGQFADEFIGDEIQRHKILL